MSFFTNIYFEQNITFLEHPNQLNNKIETIEVSYVNWACDCADFYDLDLKKNNPDYEISDADCFFIEPSDLKNQLPESYFDSIYRYSTLKLKGQFYIDKGISKTYELKTSEKPKPAKVFKYDTFEIIKNKRQENDIRGISFISLIDLSKETKDGIYLNGYVVNLEYDQLKKYENKKVRISGEVAIVEAVNNNNDIIGQGRSQRTKHIKNPKIEIIK